MKKMPFVLDEAMVRKLEGQAHDIPDIIRHTDLWDISYESDGLLVKGILACPKESGVDKCPCVVYNRGGRSDRGAITPKAAVKMLARIASWGYTVVASQYRETMGSEGKDEYGGKDVNDVISLIPLFEQIPTADPSRIGIMGHSRGGLMTYRALTLTNRFSAAIVMGGVADSYDLVSRHPEMEQDVLVELSPKSTTTREQALELRSPILWTEQLCKKTPILLLHGGADCRVHPTQALRMASALYEGGHPFRLVLFEGADHSLSEFRSEVLQTCRTWLDRYVRDREPWPSLDPH